MISISLCNYSAFCILEINYGAIKDFKKKYNIENDKEDFLFVIDNNKLKLRCLAKSLVQLDTISDFSVELYGNHLVMIFKSKKHNKYIKLPFKAI